MKCIILVVVFSLMVGFVQVFDFLVMIDVECDVFCVEVCVYLFDNFEVLMEVIGVFEEC